MFQSLKLPTTKIRLAFSEAGSWKVMQTQPGVCEELLQIIRFSLTSQAVACLSPQESLSCCRAATTAPVREETSSLR
jgi:hypothetical protein